MDILADLCKINRRVGHFPLGMWGKLGRTGSTDLTNWILLYGQRKMLQIQILTDVFILDNVYILADAFILTIFYSG